MNETLAQFFYSGRVVDVAMALTLVEGVALAVYHRSTGNGVAPRHYALNMAAGLFLMLALRFALLDSGWVLVALCLSASGVVHALDLISRWQRTSHQPNFR